MKLKQSTDTLILIRPANFSFNKETAASNTFQNEILLTSHEALDSLVKNEFDNFVNALNSNGINTIIINDTEKPIKPDAIFPNNWVSFHEDGTIVLYPMCTENRRLERRMDIIDGIKKDFEVTRVIDYSHYENQNKFLEGTGSIVFDHLSKIAYACLSSRTDKELFVNLCTELNYHAIWFTAQDHAGKNIYHTNVMMCIGEKFVIICSDSIIDGVERAKVLASLKNTGHEIVEISFSQMNHFAGNMLVVLNTKKEHSIVLSQSAFDALTVAQKNKISLHGKLLPMSIPTIETIGGGSARCMIAEVFLKKR